MYGRGNRKKRVAPLPQAMFYILKDNLRHEYFSAALELIQKNKKYKKRYDTDNLILSNTNILIYEGVVERLFEWWLKKIKRTGNNNKILDDSTVRKRAHIVIRGKGIIYGRGCTYTRGMF